jgi:DNA-binding SARP family transcriptional activator
MLIIEYLMVNTNKPGTFKFWSCCLVFFITTFFGVTWTSAQGLRFNSNDSLINKRTSYNVFELESPRFEKQLTIRFDLSLWDIEHFGYILNITDDGQNSYSLTYSHKGNRGNLYFNIDGKTNKLQIPLQKHQLIRRKWLKIRLRLDLEKDSVIITLNNKQFRAAEFGFSSQLTPKIVFGKNDRYTDVPDMAIRNLSVSDDSKAYAFPLNEWNGDKVYSKQGDWVGNVLNPNWLINESYFWKPVFSSVFNTPAGLNFDAARNDLILYSKDSLIRYNLVTSDLTGSRYSTQIPLSLLLGKSVINNRERNLYAYELNPQDKTKATIAALNLEDLSWKALGRASLPEQRHHHNSFFDQSGDRLYVFGGYGGFAYHSDFLEYNRAKDSWDRTKFTGDTITPRFFSAAGPAADANEIYIFGGYGNQSGNQVVGAVHYYDLYRVNLQTHRITKCWEIEPDEKGFIPANNLVLSPDGKYFYALCYPHEDVKTNLRLYRFSVSTGKYEVLSGRIPVVSERIESDINLFFDKASRQFVCTVQEFTSPDRSTVKVWSLSYPPVTEQMYLQSVHKGSPKRNIHLILGTTIGALVLIGFYLLRKKKRNAVQSHIEPSQSDSEIVGNVSPASGASIQMPAEDSKSVGKASAIYLLGEFAVYDNNGSNITHLFSPKIQQLFVLILLNSKEGKGVPSKRISAVLWPEKELSKTKNIKGVTINHLRSILRDIDGVELTFLNDHYRFTFDDGIFCDYFTIDSFVTRSGASNEQIADLLPVLLRGNLLPSMQDAWIDDFKNAFEQSIVERLLPELDKAYESENYKLTVDLTRAILKVDPFNDTAIKFQLNALRRLKGKDMALKCFQQFKDEYEVSLGIQYPLTFEELCG